MVVGVGRVPEDILKAAHCLTHGLTPVPFSIFRFYDFPSAAQRMYMFLRFAGSQCSFSPLKGNAAPGEPSVQPLAAAFSQGGAVIASDEKLRFPIWENARQCVVAMLGGATAQEAEAMLLSLITAEAGDAS